MTIGQRPQLSAAKVRNAVVSSIIGNGLEWYDFLLYGFFSPIIAQAFFPTEDPLLHSLVSGATFAIAFLVRPLSGVVIGLYADKFGRKPALTMMIVLMGVATLLIGLTPSYKVIGVAAPMLIIFARLLQGISVGGEFASATAMLAEYAPPGKKIFYGSFQMCSQAIALVLSSGAGYVAGVLFSPEDLASWGWRIPFILGAFIAPIGFYIRRHVDETPEFSEMLAERKVVKMPLKTVFAQNTPGLLKGLGTVIAGTVSNYVWYVSVPLYVIGTLKMPFSTVLLSNVVCGSLLFVLSPVAGKVGDRVGPLAVWTIGAIGYAVLSFPMLAYLIAEPSVERMMLAQIVGTFFIAMLWGTQPGMMASFFPVGVRSTGMSISYNVGVLLFGGLAPLTLSTLLALTGNRMVPAFYIAFSVSIALILVWGPVFRARRSAGTAISPAE